MIARVRSDLMPLSARLVDLGGPAAYEVTYGATTRPIDGALGIEAEVIVTGIAEDEIGAWMDGNLAVDLELRSGAHRAEIGISEG